jgi:hypothetical protein
VSVSNNEIDKNKKKNKKCGTCKGSYNLFFYFFFAAVTSALESG